MRFARALSSAAACPPWRLSARASLSLSASRLATLKRIPPRGQTALGWISGSARVKTPDAAPVPPRDSSPGPLRWQFDKDMLTTHVAVLALSPLLSVSLRLWSSLALSLLVSPVLAPRVRSAAAARQARLSSFFLLLAAAAADTPRTCCLPAWPRAHHH